MEFVIWGVGNRGKMIANLIGYQSVRAFIDSDPLLQGTQYHGIPVIDIMRYVGQYREYILIVSPFDHKKIIEILRQNKICNYLLLNDCPYELFSGQLDSINEISFSGLDCSKVIIYGQTLYSLLLWESFFKKGISVPWLIQENHPEKKSLFSDISDHVYDENEYDYAPDQIIIQTVKYPPQKKGIKVIDVYRLAEYADKFYHPGMLRFQKIHTDERCFIIGNGSSLRVSDLNRLLQHRIICFGMNGIPLIFKYTKWRPDYYVCEDGKAMDLFGDIIRKSQLDCILVSDTNEEFLEQTKNSDHMHVFHMTIEDYVPQMPSFSEHIEKTIYCGYTVAYVCIQIAAYMGFREIYLLGMDFDYADGDTVEVRHFDESYHADQNKINPCRKTENLLAWQAARQYAQSHEIRIYNATRGGKLEIFKRAEFDSLF